MIAVLEEWLELVKKSILRRLRERLSKAKYYADIGGLLTTDDNEGPDKVGVTKDTDEIILKAW